MRICSKTSPIYLNLKLAPAFVWMLGLITLFASCSSDKNTNSVSSESELSAKTQNPLPDLAAAAVLGKPLYAVNCAACHADSGTGDSDAIGALAAKPADLTANDVVAAPDGKIFLVIKNGVKKNGKITMPPVQGLSDEQIWQLVAYVRTLAKK